MPRVPGWISLAVLACAAAPSLAITIRDDRTDSQYRDLGADPKYSSVGYMTWPGFACSAVLISPKWVLTAAHCVDTSDTRTFFLNGGSFTDAQHFAHPAWTGNAGSGSDIGLTELSTPINSVTPASLSLINEVGMLGTTVGFGLTGTGLTGYGGFSNLKRGETNMLDALGSSIGFASSIVIEDFDDPGDADGKNSLGSSLPTDLEGLTAPGDSGGGTFVDIGSRWYLTDVTSFGTTGSGASGDGNINSSYSDIAGFIRVSSFLSWIDDNMAHAWIGGSSTFNNSANWSLGPSAIHEVPGTDDLVNFSSSGAYTVTFTGNVDNWQALVRRGNVMIDLGGFTWNLRANNFDGALVVGRSPSGELSQFTVSNGNLNTTETIVGFSANSTLQMGDSAVWNNSGDVYVGGDFIQQRSIGKLNLLSATTPPNVNVAGTLRVYSTGTVNYNGGSLSVGALDVPGGHVILSPGANKVLRSGGVSVSGSGRIDLADNKMVVSYSGASPVDSIATLINSGYAGGTWSGPGIATSLGDATHGLGFGDNASLNRPEFGGQTVDATSILIGYTYYGDANLDGIVDVTDLGALATNWQTSASWIGGDFNYDGFVDVTDLGKLATNWQAGVSAALATMSFNEALTSLGLPLSSVPEPTSAIAALLMGGLLMRRSRKS